MLVPYIHSFENRADFEKFINHYVYISKNLLSVEIKWEGDEDYYWDSTDEVIMRFRNQKTHTINSNGASLPYIFDLIVLYEKELG